MSRFLRASFIAVVAFSLAACAESAPPAASPTPDASGPAVPTPTATAATVASPTLPGDGECSSVLTDAQLDEMLGEGWMTYDEQLTTWDADRLLLPRVSSAGTVGGWACDWVADQAVGAGSPQSLGVLVLPAQAAPAAADDFVEARCDPAYDAVNCRLAKSDGGVWIMARAGYQYEEPPVEFLESVIDSVVESLDDASAWRGLDETAEWWGAPSCDALAEKMRLEEIIGEGFGAGYWEGSEQPEQAILAGAGVEFTCPWFTGSTLPPDGEHYIVSAVIMPGGAWKWSAIAAMKGAESISVPGATEALAFERGKDATHVYVTDGVNLLEIGGAPSDVLSSIAQRALTALE
jgi:hypothetical protein